MLQAALNVVLYALALAYRLSVVLAVSLAAFPVYLLCALAFYVGMSCAFFKRLK